MGILETIIGLVVCAVANSGTGTGEKLKSGLETASSKAKEYNENLERKATKVVSERSTQELERKLKDPNISSKGKKIIEDELKRR